jgi:hypothetical protein
MQTGVDFVTGDGAEHTLRLTTAAGMRLEKATGVSIMALTQGDEMEKRLGFLFIAEFFAATLRDGKGMAVPKACEVIDNLEGGLTEAAELLAATLGASFGGNDEASSSGNGPPRKRGKGGD